MWDVKKGGDSARRALVVGDREEASNADRPQVGSPI